MRRPASPLLTVVLLLLTAGGEAKRRRGNKGRNNICKVAGCQRCVSGDKNKCEICRAGWALTEDDQQQCGVCADNCKTCKESGPGRCDTCKPGFTVSPISKQCERCAPHCLECNEAGPGGCNECGKRRMLHVRLEVEGEVHECLPCGHGCGACSEQDGCLKCDAFYKKLPSGDGCYFSMLSPAGLITGTILVLFIGCLCAVAYDDATDYREPARVPQRSRRQQDAAQTEVLRRQDSDGSVSARRRSGLSERSEHSPPRVRKEPSSGAYPLMQGYTNIEIVDKY